ncbi:hypothetical protein [Planktomarina sp.]|uniref:hypothetical protein n=1 Tax=Planktomarina sp. TaxID=2024851 RepID=UPI0032601EB5
MSEYVLTFSDPMKNGKLVELPFLTYEDVQEYIETNISPYNANKPFNEQISTRIIFPPEEYGAESEIDRYNKHMDEILEVKARLLEENIGDYDPNDPEQEAENDAIYEVFSKYYPDIYGAEKTVPLNYTPDIAPYAGVFDKMEVTFKIQDADYATFYYTTDVPSGLRRHSNEHIVSYVWGDECELQDDDWFYCPYDWNGVGEHYLAKVMNKTLKAESFGAEIDAQENLRLTILSFIDDSWGEEDEEAWRRHLNTYDTDRKKAQVLDKIMAWHDRMQLQSDGIADELDRMKWMLENPDKDYDDYDDYAESFGAEYGKRQRFGNRYIARDTKGRIISNVSVGRSLKADRRNKSKTPARSGFGHKGDSQKGASGEFKLPTDAKSVIGIGAVLGGLLAYLESKA